MNPPSAHTPPPWYPRPVNPHENNPDNGWDLEGPPQALGSGQFAKLADANIASAAPELYDVTKLLITIAEQIDSPNPEVQQVLNQAQTAIQKASTPSDTQRAHSLLI